MPNDKEALYHILRGEQAAGDSIERLVSLMQTNPHVWSDLDTTITQLRDKVNESPASDRWWKPKDITDSVDRYSQFIQLPWKQEMLPDAYKTTSLTDPRISLQSGTYGYIDPKYNEMWIGNPSPAIYFHEKAHAMQRKGGNTLQDLLVKGLEPFGKTMENEYQIPYEKQPREIGANRFVDFIAELTGRKGNGVDPSDPMLQLFRSGYESDRISISPHKYITK